MSVHQSELFDLLSLAIIKVVILVHFTNITRISAVYKKWYGCAITSAKYITTTVQTLSSFFVTSHLFTTTP